MCDWTDFASHDIKACPSCGSTSLVKFSDEGDATACNSDDCSCYEEIPSDNADWEE